MSIGSSPSREVERRRVRSHDRTPFSRSTAMIVPMAFVRAAPLLHSRWTRTRARDQRPGVAARMETIAAIDVLVIVATTSASVIDIVGSRSC